MYYIVQAVKNHRRKRMKEKKSNIGKYLLILVPFVMGVIGFTVLDGQPVVDSLFLSMEMYFLNYSDSPPNILIEIARWTAQLMTASGVLMSISKIRGKILQLLRYYRGDSIAVYRMTFTGKKWYRHWNPAG